MIMIIMLAIVRHLVTTIELECDVNSELDVSDYYVAGSSVIMP